MQTQFFRLLYHINWSTKMRDALITVEIKQPLYNYLKGKCRDLGGVLLAIGGTHNHIHLVLAIPPSISLSDFVRKLKGASSHWINHNLNPGCDFAWQSGYAAFTLADVILDRVKAYVRDQEEHHAKGKLNASLEKSGYEPDNPGG